MPGKRNLSITPSARFSSTSTSTSKAHLSPPTFLDLTPPDRRRTLLLFSRAPSSPFATDRLAGLAYLVIPGNTHKHDFQLFRPFDEHSLPHKGPNDHTILLSRAPALLCSALRPAIVALPTEIGQPDSSSSGQSAQYSPEETLGTDAAPCRHPPSKPPTVEYETLRSRSCPQFIGSISPPRLSTVDRESIAQFVNDSNPLGKF